MVRELFFPQATFPFAILSSLALLLTGCSESHDRTSSAHSAASNLAAANRASENDDGPQLDSPLQEPDDSHGEKTPTESASSSAEGEASEPAGITPESTPPAQAKRDPIYLEEANGKELIAAALQKAKQDHKHVLIEWGGNWCGWCYKLHDVFHHDVTVHPIVAEQFELVLIDNRENRDLMLEYGGKDREYSFPHLTILDWEGRVLVNQETGCLEDGPRHDPKLVSEFLTKWLPKKHE